MSARVAFVTTQYPQIPGRHSNLCFEMVQSLSSLGFQIELLTKAQAEISSGSKNPRISVHKVIQEKLINDSLFASQIVMKLRPQLFHFHISEPVSIQISGFLLSLIAQAQFLGAPVVATVCEEAVIETKSWALMFPILLQCQKVLAPRKTPSKDWSYFQSSLLSFESGPAKSVFDYSISASLRRRPRHLLRLLQILKEKQAKVQLLTSFERRPAIFRHLIDKTIGTWNCELYSDEIIRGKCLITAEEECLERYFPPLVGQALSLKIPIGLYSQSGMKNKIPFDDLGLVEHDHFLRLDLNRSQSKIEDILTQLQTMGPSDTPTTCYIDHLTNQVSRMYSETGVQF